MSTETDPSQAVRMEIVPDGPLRISGQVEIVDKDGAVVFEGDKTAICRCGLSAKKPFCDGTHRKQEWKEDA